MSEPSSTRTPFRIGFVPGVMPDKWARRWRQRNRGQELELVPLAQSADHSALADRVDMAFLRLPVDTERFHAIPLYEETTVVVVAVDHPVTAYDEVRLADLAGEQLVSDPAAFPGFPHEAVDGLEFPEMTPAQEVEVAASGSGVALMPMSLARLHHRKDATYRVVVDGPLWPVGLVWPRDVTDGRFDGFIGVVRGRTQNSSRGR